ncbi:MAG TPA: glycosyltransferase family 2 protein [Actinomycetota bacterium]|nr:glycosyltransferase family 2 protein [Actinomycetota bacterium]
MESDLAGRLIALRVIGGAFAAVLLISSTIRFRRRRISRLNLLISWTVGLGIGLVAALPDVVNPVFEVFNFRRGGGQRLLGLLLLANLLLFALVLRNLGQTDLVSRDLRLLIEVLGTHSFDWEKTETLPDGDRIVVVMPAHNEAENVGDVIRSMPRTVEGVPVVSLVVDDASTDGTADVVEGAGGLVARLPVRRGGGLALRVGYELALRLGAVVVASMDADGQHMPGELPAVVAPILRDEVDMVQGSRVLGEFDKESHIRHLGIRFFSRVVSLMTGVRVTDVSNGYRATRTETLRKLVLEQDQFWTSEILLEGLRQHARITEVPVTVRARAGGESKKPKSFKYGWNFTKAILQTWLR